MAASGAGAVRRSGHGARVGERGGRSRGFIRRFAKLLLRLPALRSIGLKCLEHLFFFKLIGDTPIDTFLMEMLEAPHQMT